MNPWLAAYLGACVGGSIGLIVGGMLSGAKRADAHLEATRHRVCRDCGCPGTAGEASCPVCGGKEVPA